MAQKFFGTIFRRRRGFLPRQKTQVTDFNTIKPATDIADFEYPPESSFYRESEEQKSKY